MLNTNEDLRTLEQKIEDAHSKLLSLDQQYSRIQKLYSSKDSELMQLQEIRLDLEKSIEELTTKKENSTLDVSNLEKSKEQLFSQIQGAQNELVIIKSEGNRIKEDLHEREISIGEKESELTERENDVQDREDEVDRSEEIINAKHQKIKDLAKNL